jgi:hypothetical protein
VTVQTKNKFYQNLLAAMALVLMIVGAYHVVVDWLLKPVFTTLGYLASIPIEDKVLLVILVLGLTAIWMFRTKKPPPAQGGISG